MSNHRQLLDKDKGKQMTHPTKPDETPRTTAGLIALKLFNRSVRLVKLTQLQAPAIIVENERRLVAQALDEFPIDEQAAKAADESAPVNVAAGQGGRATGKYRLVYNKVTKKIDKVSNFDGLAVESFDPPEYCNGGPATSTPPAPVGEGK